MGLLDFLSPALTVGTNAVAAHQAGELQGQQRDQANMLAMLKLKRDMEDQATDDAYKKSQTEHAKASANEAAARAAWLGRDPVKTIVNDQGAVSVVGTRLDANGNPVAHTVPGVTGVTKPEVMTPTASGMVGGRGEPTGTVHVMRDAAGNIIKPVPPRPRAGAGGAPGMETVHTLSTLNAQINDTRARLARAEALAKPLNEMIDSSLTTGRGMAEARGAATNVSGLRTRLDSLTRVRDRVAAGQQGRVLPPGPVQPPPGDTPPPGIVLPPAPKSSRAQDSTAADANYQRIMRSQAPANIKAEATRLYRQHMIELKSSARPDEPAGDDDGGDGF